MKANVAFATCIGPQTATLIDVNCGAIPLEESYITVYMNAPDAEKRRTGRIEKFARSIC